jgi:RNA polymerase sigma-70 factor (ECF subfamily)
MTSYTSGNVLMEKVKAGNQQAFQQLFELYRDKLYSYSFRITKHEGGAEEIVQDVFMKIWTGRQQIDPSQNINAYLYKITEHMALNFLKKLARDRKLKEKVAVFFQESHNQTEDTVIYQDYEALLQKAIISMPPQRKLIFELSRKECLTHEEIASQLNISRHTVRNQIIAAVQTIRQYLSRNSRLRLPLIILLISRYL